MRVAAPVISLLVLFLAELAHAQDRPQADPPSPAAGFFRGKRVSFWGENPAEKAAAPSGQVESLWAEPIRLPDGRMTIYVPPKQVLAFLETPSEESGRAYLAWQKERMEKMARAAEILARLSGRASTPPKTEPAAMPRREVPAAGPEAATRDKATEKAEPPTSGDLLTGGSKAEELLYFKRSGCPHCTHQDPEIWALMKERPGLKVKVLMPGEEEDLWKTFGVEVVPTVILTRADGKRAVARGFTPKSALVRALTANQGEPK